MDSMTVRCILGPWETREGARGGTLAKPWGGYVDLSQNKWGLVGGDGCLTRHVGRLIGNASHNRRQRRAAGEATVIED
eukprot:3164285-Pyramimonas_sp.AAC.1